MNRHCLVMEWGDVLKCHPQFSTNGMCINLSDHYIESILNVHIKYLAHSDPTDLHYYIGYKQMEKFMYKTNSKNLIILGMNNGVDGVPNNIDYIEIDYYSISKDRDDKISQLID